MDTMMALEMGMMNRGKESRVFDWMKAVCFMKKYHAEKVFAGLREDWEWTSGCILQNGTIHIDEWSSMYLASTWATPVIVIDGEEMECWTMASMTEYDAHTIWPDEARLAMMLSDLRRSEMEFDKSKILTVMTGSKELIGKKGWFADTPKEMEERVTGIKPTKLVDFDVDSMLPFESTWHHFNLFYPAE